MMKEYAECVEKASDKYRETLFNVTKLAAEYIDVDQQNFQASLQEAQAIPELMQQMNEDQESVRQFCEKKRDVPLKKDQVKAAFLEKIKLEFESDLKMKKFRAPSQEEMNKIVQFEKTRVMDQVYINHQVKFHEIMAAI